MRPRPKVILIALCVLAVSASFAALAPAQEAPPQLACSEAAVRQMADRFISSFNRGNTSQLDRLWSRPRFRSYSAAQARPVVRNHLVRSRSKLVGYFARRHGQGERLHLLTFKLSSRSRGHAQFEFTLQRLAPDLSAGHLLSYQGTGVVSCETVTNPLAAWTMSQS